MCGLPTTFTPTITVALAIGGTGEPDRTFRTFAAATVEEANAIAEEANANRHLHRDPTSTAFAVERYIQYAQRIRPSLKGKQSWRNRCYAMRQFARNFPTLPINPRTIWQWWDTLTHSQQILREAEFRKMWTFFRRECFVVYDANPFDQERLIRREKADSQRERLTLEGYWRIYEKARPGIQIAMGISLLTTLRRGDVVQLTRANVHGGYLKKTISKSEERRGIIKAARLQWKLADHPELAALIEHGLSSAPAGCPFIVHDRPQVRRLGKSKIHVAQMLPRRLTDGFAEARDAAGIGGANPPTFHEIRSLASALLAQQGEELTDVMDLMGHSEEQMTRLYQSGHALPWQTVTIRLRNLAAKW